MKGESHTRYRWTDAWLLAAVALASKSKSALLWEIIAAGDALNHALFTDEEIESGLARLTRGGWVAERDETFLVTSLFQEKKIAIKGGYSVEKIQKLLGAEPWQKDEPMPHPSNNLRYPGITREILYKANKEYEKHAKAELKKLKTRYSLP